MSKQFDNNFVIPTDLFVANKSIFKTKIAEFTEVGAQGIHAVFDFDRTLTVKKPGSHDEVTTWHILREHLPPEAQTKYQALFEKYRALELSGEMTSQDAVDWWNAVLKLFIDNKISLAEVDKDFLDKASVRPGTLDLFKLFADNNIPIVILSAGIREVIDLWCHEHGITPSLVVSTELLLDENHAITGWKEDTLVHVLNKSEATHPELLAMRAKRSKVFLVGDSMDDAAMASGEQNVIRTRILDPRSDETANEEEKHKTFQKFDALISCGSLDPVRGLVEHVIRHK